MRRAAAGLVVLGAVVATTAASPAGRAPGLRAPAGVVKSPKLAATLARVDRVAAADGRVAATVRADALGLDTAGSRVAVELTTRDAADATQAVEALGGSVRARYRGLLEALVPPGALDELAARGAVAYVGVPARPQPAAVLDEGVAVTGADAWQTIGMTGKGVKIAIIDVGFKGWQAQQLAGELPAAVATKDFCTPGRFDGLDADDHGTAVAEIVHDMAPDARLYLVCVDSIASLGQAKDYAVGKGVGIVNHSVGWYNTARGDGTGPATSPDGIVADARVHGILWVNSAGNDAQNHWTGTFTDGDGNNWHDFEPTNPINGQPADEGNAVFVASGDEICAYLRWDDWPTSAQDYDLYLWFDPNPGAVGNEVMLARSTNLQSGTQPPTESLCYTNTGSPRALDFAIRRDNATATPRFDLFTTRGPLQYNTTSGSLFEPATSPHVLTVGAACSAGSSLEPYSSQGPTVDGRTKPDLTAPDGVSTATFGRFTSCHNANAGFFGTSASAPQVSGAAALLKQANPTFGPAELQAGLEASATDVGPPGKDDFYGSGLLTLGKAPPAPTAPPTAADVPVISGTPQEAHALTATTGGWTGPAPLVYAYQWLRCDAAGAACVEIDGALAATYTPTSADVVSRLRVEVTAINTGGGTASTSGPTATVLPLPPANTAAPAISGRPRIGETLMAALGTWTGSAPISYRYDWRRCSPAGDACAGTGVTTQSYALGTADVGATLRVAVTASNAGGSTSAVSSPSGAVLPAAPQNTAPPTLTGAARVGVTLQAATGTWNGASSYAYRWWRCFASNCAYVDRATGPAYLLGNADVGATLRVVVTASNSGGSTTASSAATGVVTVALGTRAALVAGSVGHTRPVAGRLFTVQMRVARRPSGGTVSGRATCRATLRGRALRATRHTLARGVATCAWRLPASAAGNRVSGSVRATAGGLSVTKRFSVVVGRR
ncbi:MAG TPA: S8 family serine peptidase [Solirubrobacteraceae bacterium]